MKKHLVLWLSVLLGIGASVEAKTVSVSDAQKVAVNFFNINAANLVGKSEIQATLFYTKSEPDNSPDFYVFNMQPVTGFVIVAASDNVRPVLAYSTESAFKGNIARSGVSNWMLHASTHVAKAVSQNIVPTDEIVQLWTAYITGVTPAIVKATEVAPLVHTSWNQEPYYNALCPEAPDSPQAVTGCVATAMAQIMKFWDYPAHGTGSYSYNDGGRNYKFDYGTQSANFGATTYDWDVMPNSLESVDTPVAQLMYQCGVSVAMDYGNDNQGGSGSFVLQAEAWGNSPCAQTAFPTYFGYDPNLIQGQFLSNANSNADWLATIEAELNAGRPVLYQGSDAVYGGHAWVADGYNANGVHMNWGWGGENDGFYDLTNLDPDGLLFNQDDGALIGIQPIRATVVTNVNTASICYGDTTSLVAESSPLVTYTWTPGTGLSCPSCATTQAFPSSTTTYTVKVDSSGYIGTANVTITVTPNLSAAGGPVTNAVCYGEPTGELSVSVSGGTPGFSYTWSNGSSSAVNKNLIEGTYAVTVKDAAGCSAVVSQSVTSPPQIILSTDASGATSCTGSNGSVTITASGGSGAPYSYLWSNGDTAGSLSGLKAGVYPVTVTDSTSCTTVTNVIITQPYQIQVTIDASNSTNGNNGSVTIANVTEGIAPYTYVWSNGDTTQDISKLAPGKYTVTVTDENGCYETASAQVNQTTAITKVADAFTFSVYPNPANANALIQIGNLGGNVTLSLVNILGQTLLTRSLTEAQTQVDLSSYSSGVYLLELRQGDKRAVKQLVISR